MPELPEIETLRKSLFCLAGKVVASVYFSSLAPIAHIHRKKLQKHFLGQQLNLPERHGKYLLLRCVNQDALVLHLGMSGKLLYYENKFETKTKHTHMMMSFSDGSTLHYIDPRRFGTLSLACQNQTNPFLSRLGPDLLDTEFKVEAYLQRVRRHPKVSLKMLLLHQGVASGLGNIYACEALYLAGLDPRRCVRECSEHEIKKLFQAAQKVLRLGVARGGTTFRDYVDGRGVAGQMKKSLQVYGREGQTTLDGRGQVIRIVQQGRSTWFCPTVQT